MSNTIEEVLEKYGELTYTCKGTSMLPMLRPQKDVFTISKKTQERCKENDVVLCKMKDKYILHRIVKVFDNHYSLMGDNCISYEENIKDKEILGVLVSFQRDGHSFSVNDKRYQVYVKLNRILEKPRIVIRKFKINVKHFIRNSIYK